MGQEKDHLVLRLRTPRTGNNAVSPQLNLCKIAAGKAVHVIVSYFSGHTYCFVNGEQALNTTTIQGNFSNWEPCHLLFGDEWDGNRHWAGLVEGVSIYNRFIGPDEARRKYQLFQGKKAGVERPKKVIFETDMCLDVDDVGALATLHAMADRGEAEILAVCFNEVHPSGAAAIDAINTWYHRGKIPIGIYKGPFDNPDGSKYLDYVADFPHDLTRETAPSALDVYQNVLREQPDNSVTIVSVGFLNNLYDLLKADSDLVAQKVTKLVVMGGLINDNFNLVRHNLAEESEYVIRNWPTPLVISQHGGKTRTGAKLSEASEENPVREAFYRWFSEKFEGRSSWDQIAVLYGVRGLGDYFDEITRGTGRLSNGFEWQMKPGSRAYLNARLPDNEFADIIEDLMITPPR